MTLPKTLEEWERVSPAWRDKARRMIPEGGYPGPRTRPRDPEEEALLRRLGLDRQKPFGLDDEAADVALQIRRARKATGLSQAQLAERMGVTQQWVQRLEDPDRSNPTVETLGSIARALGRLLRIDLAQESMPDRRTSDRGEVQARAARRRERMTANVAKSFAEADRWDLEFWQTRTPEERLSAFVALRRDVEKAIAARGSHEDRS